MKIITGATGTAHVTSDDDRQFNMAVWGDGDYVLPNGSKFACSVIDANTVKISDGDLVMQGCHARIYPNTTEDCIIELLSPSEGIARLDVIVARYTLDISTGLENVELAVIKGTPVNNWSITNPLPIPTIQDKTSLRNGDTVHEMPLYYVTVTQGFPVCESVFVQGAYLGQYVTESSTILYTTLFSGETVASMRDSRIKKSSIIEPYFQYLSDNPSTNAPVSYDQCFVEDGEITFTFSALADDVEVGVKIINNYVLNSYLRG